ncbi:MAG: hypothetical protein P8J23_05255 [Rhodothermales bacterium]|nr:hypothetical protein [Rhodothermales bacterium]HAY37515.1 hypothetical protein [Bacteroidota bacterium]
MSRLIIALVLVAGCATFAPIDLRLDQPAELGDTLALGTTEARYSVVGFDPVYYEQTTIIKCDNIHDEIRAQCEEGGICYAIKKISGESSIEPTCMNEDYVTSIYTVKVRASNK